MKQKNITMQTSKCKNCGKEYDKNETGRVYGTHFIDLPYCSAICYTKAQTAPTPLEVNEGKHTPGKVQTDGLAIIGERPELEICVVTCDDDIRRSEAEANAAHIVECWNGYEDLRSEICTLKLQAIDFKEANRELLSIMDEVLSEWHKKSSNFTKTEPAYLEKIRKAISKHSKQTT